MSRFFFTVCALSAGVSFSSLAVAQQPSSTVPNQPNQVIPQQQNAQQQNGQPAQQQPAVVGQNSRGDGQNNQARMSVTQLLVKKLRKANEGEVQLAKMVQEKSDNKDLKKYTDMVIQDHQALLQQLDQVTGKPADALRGARGASAASVTQDLDRNTVDQDQTRPTTADQANGAATSDATLNSQVKKPVQGQAGTESRGPRGMQAQQVPQQLWQIIDQACDNSHKMTTEMLKQHEGQDFQMAYLGYEIVAHTMHLGELQAIQSAGPQELKQLAQMASEKTKSHLDMAKQLAKKHQDDRKQE